MLEWLKRMTIRSTELRMQEWEVEEGYPLRKEIQERAYYIQLKLIVEEIEKNNGFLDRQLDKLFRETKA